jgi:hypothetical protein
VTYDESTFLVHALPDHDIPPMKDDPVVVDPEGNVRSVKNLGWLVRHSADVRELRVQFPRHVDDDGKPILVAYLNDGTRYATNFEDVTVLRKWVHRASLRGRRLYWFGEPTHA